MARRCRWAGTYQCESPAGFGRWGTFCQDHAQRLFEITESYRRESKKKKQPTITGTAKREDALLSAAGLDDAPKPAARTQPKPEVPHVPSNPTEEAAQRRLEILAAVKERLAAGPLTSADLAANLRYCRATVNLALRQGVENGELVELVNPADRRRRLLAAA